MSSPAAKPIAPLDLAALLLVAVVWGINNLAAKIALTYFPPLMTAGLRFAMVSAVLVMFLRPPPGAWRTLALVGLTTGVLHFGVQSIGLWMAKDLSPMVIAMQTWIPASVAFSSIFLHERAGPVRLAGMGIAFFGIVVLAIEPSVFSQLGAFAIVALASIVYGAIAIVVRRVPGVHPLTFQAWIALCSWPILFPLSALTEHGQIEAIQRGGWMPWAMLAWGALAGSVIGNALMFAMVQRYEMARTTPYMFLSPLIGISLGIIVLHDPINPQIALGAAITLGGVALVSLAERRFASARAAPAE
jgi:O-acetylserine/cysteine efflux transporter